MSSRRALLVVGIAIVAVLWWQRAVFQPGTAPDHGRPPAEALAWLRMLEPERYGSQPDAAILELRELRIDGSEIDAAVNARFRNGDLHHLSAFPALRKLELWNTALDDEGLAALGRLAQLESLAIGGWSVRYTDEGLRHLRSLSSLERLKLTQAQRITDDGMRSVAALPALSFLDITYTKISNEGLEHLIEAKTLAEVDYGWAAETRRWRERFLADHPGQRILR